MTKDIPSLFCSNPFKHGRPQGGGHLPPLEFEKMTSYAAVLQNTLKFSLAPSALAIYTLYFSLKRAKKRKNFRLRLRRAEKWSIFCTARRKRVNFLKRRWFCPPLEKFLRAPIGGGLSYVGGQSRRKGQCRRECKVAVEHQSSRAGPMSPCQVNFTTDQY